MIKKLNTTYKNSSLKLNSKNFDLTVLEKYMYVDFFKLKIQTYIII